MAKVLYDHVADFNYTNEIINARLYNVTTAQRAILAGVLGAANEGYFVYDTDVKGLFTWNGIGWDNYLARNAVLSFKGRTGHVMPLNNDYHITQISGFPGQTGNGGKFLSTSGSSLTWLPLPTIFTAEQVRDIIGAALCSDFTYDDTANTICINEIDWDKIINAPAFILNESDPTVPAWVKTIEIGANLTHYLNWDGTKWISKKISYNEIANLPVIPAQYTNENAQDTVASMILSGSHTGIVFNYNDTLNTLSAVVTAQAGGHEITFTVGDVDAPQVDDTEFTLVDCNDIIAVGAKVRFFRERDLQIEGDDYTYNSTTGVVTVVVPFLDNERIVIWILDAQYWTSCQLVAPSDNAAFTYILPFTLT